MPGIWLLPFTAARTSQLFKDHPDWFVRTGRTTRYTARESLDSSPAVREHTRKLFHKLSHEWGFRCKLDGSSATWHRRHSDPHWTALMNLREAARLKLGRPEDVHPAARRRSTSAGLWTAWVSCDIFERWQSVKDVFMSVFKRYSTTSVSSSMTPTADLHGGERERECRASVSVSR